MNERIDVTHLAKLNKAAARRPSILKKKCAPVYPVHQEDKSIIMVANIIVAWLSSVRKFSIVRNWYGFIISGHYHRLCKAHDMSVSIKPNSGEIEAKTII